MHYPFQTSPYAQATMAQALQALMSGAPLPSNCIVMTIPMQQAQQILPQLMMATANTGGGALMLPQSLGFYGQPLQPPFMDNQYSRALVPYPNYYPPNYEQNYNYPMIPYSDHSDSTSKKNRRGKRHRQQQQQSGQPHSNVYNSSSFDTDMRNLSWSRLFGHHRQTKHRSQDPVAIDYEKQTKKRRAGSVASSTSSSSSSSTTSDETIRRVNLTSKQSSTGSSKQQTKSSLPFKYSSEFIPGSGRQQQQQQQQPQTSSKASSIITAGTTTTGTSRKEEKVKPDDVFVVKKPPPSQPPAPRQ